MIEYKYGQVSTVETDFENPGFQKHSSRTQTRVASALPNPRDVAASTLDETRVTALPAIFGLEPLSLRKEHAEEKCHRLRPQNQQEQPFHLYAATVSSTPIFDSLRDNYQVRIVAFSQRAPSDLHSAKPGSAPMAGRPFRFGTDVWDPTHRFETSWLLSPWLLFFCRAVISLYAFTTVVFVLAWQCAKAATGCTASQNQFSYFTTLTYWGLAFYFLVAAIHTFTYARSGVALLDRFPRPLQALHSAFYTTIIVYPFVVTIVYWGRLYNGRWFTEIFAGWSNVSQHALNSVFALFELVVPRTNVPPAVHMTWLVLILALYLALAYVTKTSKGFYTYDFLNPDTQRGLVAAYVFGIAVGCLLIFGIAWGAIWLRKYITETKLGKHGKFSNVGQDRSSAAADLELGKPRESTMA